MYSFEATPAEFHAIWQRFLFQRILTNKEDTMADVSAIRNLANEGINLTKDVMGKVMKSVRGNDKRFFNSSKKGEVGEWKKKLHSLDVSEVTNAMKCVIAAMTIGTDVSMLFPDVISCIHDKTLELKKLVYLYCIF